MLYFIEQSLNGIQLGMLLFLLAAGLTLIFGIMDLVNLAHGSLYMLGAYFAATFAEATDSFVLGAILASPPRSSPASCSRSSPYGRCTDATTSTTCSALSASSSSSTIWCG